VSIDPFASEDEDFPPGLLKAKPIPIKQAP